jgi:hypothetical protein
MRAFQQRHHTRLGDTRTQFQPKLAKLARNNPRCAELFESYLRITVKVPADCPRIRKQLLRMGIHIIHRDLTFSET